MARKTLGDVAEIVMGQSPSGSTVSPDGETPLLNGPTEFGTSHPVATQFTTDGRKFAKPGDILFCVRGSTTGRMNWSDQAYAIGRGLAAIRHRSEPALQHLARAVLEYELPELLVQATGSTFPNVSARQLASVRWPDMDLNEQRTIAQILSALDNKIDLNRQLSDTLEQAATALYKSWFLDFDPVRAKAKGRGPQLPEHLAVLFPNRLVDSKVGRIPAGWTPISISEAMEINPQRPLRKGELAPYLGMADMPTLSHRPSRVGHQPFGSGTRFINGDTLVARITPCLENGKVALVDFLSDKETGWGSTEYIVMHPRPPLPEPFAYFLTRTTEFRDFAVSAMTGSSGRQRVPVQALSDFRFPLPPAGIAQAFGKIVDPLIRRSSIATENATTLTNLRDSLLPRLVSGSHQVLHGTG